jgi:HD-like signal output (HDOD) protein
MDMQDLVRAWTERDVPVLASTIAAVEILRRDEERVSGRDLSRVVLRDPLMTLRVLRREQARRTTRQPTEITTVAHAVMMSGVTNFFRESASAPCLETVLAPAPEALTGARAVISRAHHAAAYAQAIASQRHDIESEEVVIGALLHDLAELLMCCYRPEEAAQIRFLVGHARGLRSAAAQTAVLGFTYADLQLALAQGWNLPVVLRRLMDDHHAEHPRIANVLTAVSLARHSAYGWQDPALPDDLKRVEKLIGGGPDQAWRLVRGACLRAAANWEDYAVRPAAAWLPLADDIHMGIASHTRPPATGPKVFVRTCAQIKAAPVAAEDAALGALALYALHAGLGFGRVMLAEVDERAGQAATRFCFGADIAEELSWEGFAFPLAGRDLLGRLMGRPQGIWAGSASLAKLAPLISPELRHRIGHNEFVAMSVFSGGNPRFLVIADHGRTGAPIPETLYGPFKAVCATLSQRLSGAGRH